MKTTGICFTDEEVRAIFAGRKTQKRQVVKLPRWAEPDEFEIDHAFFNGQRLDWPYAIAKASGCQAAISCPYGAVGDRLWVRETWNALCDGQWWHEMKVPLSDKNVLNWAITNPVEPAFDEAPSRWLPSIHMPRWASRITLEITGVRVEMVKQISEIDAVAEGTRAKPEGEAYSPAHHSWVYKPKSTLPNLMTGAKGVYAFMWDSINAKRGYSWDENPWVWVVEFKQVPA